jgi:hypothetical protein
MEKNIQYFEDAYVELSTHIDIRRKIAELQTSEIEYQFNLNNEMKEVRKGYNIPDNLPKNYPIGSYIDHLEKGIIELKMERLKRRNERIIKKLEQSDAKLAKTDSALTNLRSTSSENDKKLKKSSSQKLKKTRSMTHKDMEEYTKTKKEKKDTKKEERSEPIDIPMMCAEDIWADL